MIEIDKYIMDAMKAHDELKKDTYRAIKAAFLVWKSAKENVGKEMTDIDQINIMKKMVKQRKESAKEYEIAQRYDLALKETQEAEIISGFLPSEVTKEQIELEIENIIKSGAIEPIKSNMGLFMKNLKTKYPTGDGKMISQVVSSRLS